MKIIKQFTIGDKNFKTNVMTNNKSLGKSLFDDSKLKMGCLEGMRKMICMTADKKDYLADYLNNN